MRQGREQSKNQRDSYPWADIKGHHPLGWERKGRKRAEQLIWMAFGK
jgi:hypothetical protein